MNLFVYFFIIFITGFSLLYYFYSNRNRRIERYFIMHDKRCYMLLQITYLILIISLFLNIRFIITLYFKKWTLKFKIFQKIKL